MSLGFQSRDGYAVSAVCPASGSASRSSLRELMPSLPNVCQVPLDGARADEELGPISGFV